MALSTHSKKAFETRTLQALLLFLLFSTPILFTLPDYGITHDEPIYMEASRNVRQWLSLDLRNMFSQESIEQYWKTDPLRNVHPSGVKWLYVIGQGLVFWEKDPYIQNRIFSILLFAVSLTLFLQWKFGPSPGQSMLAVFFLLSIPRFFAHAHFAATDIPMTAFLMLFVIEAEKGGKRRAGWLAGVFLGILASIKITSLILALPALAVLRFRNSSLWEKELRSALTTCVIASFTFYALNPDWWFSPFSRSVEFLAQTLTRKDWTPFTVYFGGKLYAYRGPFYYPFVMFSITTPLLHLCLLLLGLIVCWEDKGARKNPKTAVALVCFLVPFLVLAFPLSPTNDGIRYLLPAFPFAVCFMTLGLARLWSFTLRSARKSPILIAARLGLVASALGLFALDMHNPARRPPYELSYYNSSVGGLSGAYHKGYETTYWWEILNEDTLKEINSRTEGSNVYFPLPPADVYFNDMNAAGKIKFAPSVEPRDAAFMLLLGRPSVAFWAEETSAFLRLQGNTAIPIWGITVDSVPLLRLYRIQARGRP